MRYILTTILSVMLISFAGYGQMYNWVLKQSGSSLGGPIDYSEVNTDIVYYGSDNKIYKSTDRGETFQQTGTNVPGASEIKNIILDDSNPGTYLVAIESSPDKILKTTDDGQTWTVSLDNLSLSFFGIPMSPDPSNPNTIYTMTGVSFYRSTDFGDAWSIISTSTGLSSAPCDIEKFPSSDVILLGDNGLGIVRSTDGGFTWSQVFATSGEIPTISVSHTNPGVAFATKWAGGGGFLKSTDYGATWTSIPGFGGINMWGVNVMPNDGNIVMASCYGCGESWRSIDEGDTWTQISIPSAGYQVVVVDSITQYAAQSGGFYKLESDNFIPVELTSFTATTSNDQIVLNWTTGSELNNQGFEIQQSLDNESFSRIGFVPGFGSSTEHRSYTYTVQSAPAGLHYYRLKQIDFDGSYEYSDVIEVETVESLPTEFALDQNHPNPFNPSTSITFSLPVDSDVQLSLYNMLGQEVTKISNAHFQAGTHKVDFIAEGLSSGTYIYLFRATSSNGSDFVEAKKLTLIK